MDRHARAGAAHFRGAGWLMATTYYFIESPNRPSNVLEWLRDQDDAPQEFPKGASVLFYYHGAGDLGRNANGDFDVSRSPLVTVFPSKVRRRSLWTVGEVHFVAKHASNEFPLLESIRRRFERWLRSHPEVFDQANPQSAYTYCLEGGVQNIAPKIFALPSGFEAIEAGQYFVADGDNDFVLDCVCNSLRLRGVECE